MTYCLPVVRIVIQTWRVASSPVTLGCHLYVACVHQNWLMSRFMRNYLPWNVIPMPNTYLPVPSGCPSKSRTPKTPTSSSPAKRSRCSKVSINSSNDDCQATLQRKVCDYRGQLYLAGRRGGACRSEDPALKLAIWFPGHCGIGGATTILPYQIMKDGTQ